MCWPVGECMPYAGLWVSVCACVCVRVCVCVCSYVCVRHVLQEIGVLVWKNDAKRLMVVSRAGHDQVKRFWKKKDR